MHSTRLYALDALRGITVAIMIIVNSPGNLVAYTWATHSAWDGCTVADLVFPFFIVILGMSSVLSLHKLKIQGNESNKVAESANTKSILKKIIKRSIYIFLIGLLLNAFPKHFDLSTIRILGVLQRIALCYLFASILFVFTTFRTQLILTISIFLGYWWLMFAFSPHYSLLFASNLAGYLDRLILSPQHLYTSMFDPEGLLSTIPAIGSALLGNLLGMRLISACSKHAYFRWTISVGMMLALLGFIWSLVLPFNKSLWSSSYAVWTGGLAYIIFAMFYYLIEIKQYRAWARVCYFFGQNAMLVYVLHVLLLKIQAIIWVNNANGEAIKLRQYITDILFGHFSAANASLCYAMSYMLFCATLCYLTRLLQERYMQSIIK